MEENQSINQNVNINNNVKKGNAALAILSFVFGIVGLVAIIIKSIDLLVYALPFIVFVFFYLTMPTCSILAIIFGFISKKKFQKGTKPHLFSLLGLIFGLVGITLFIAYFAIIIIYFFQGLLTF